MSASAVSSAAATLPTPVPTLTATNTNNNNNKNSTPAPPSTRRHPKLRPDPSDMPKSISKRAILASRIPSNDSGVVVYSQNAHRHASYTSEPDVLSQQRSSDPSAPVLMPRHLSANHHPPRNNSSNSTITFTTAHHASSSTPDETTLWLREKFPDLPSGEVVIASYACALVKSILIQGRLYVTQTTLLFYSRIFGRVTKELYPMAAIRSIAPRRTGFVANAVKIKFLNPATPSVILGSLSKRERACALINSRLQSVNPALAMTSIEAEEEDNSPDDDDPARSQGSAPSMTFRSNSAGGMVEGLALQNANSAGNAFADRRASSIGSAPRFISKTTAPGSLSRDSSELFSSSDDGSLGAGDRSSKIERRDDLNLASIPNGESKPVTTRNKSVRGSENGTHRPAVFWKTPADPIDKLSGKEYASRVEQARAILNAPVEYCFESLFRGDWLKDCHSCNGNTQITQTNWERAEDGYMTRTIKFQRALGYRIGPKFTRVVETSKYSFTSAGGVIVELNGHNLDVPFGDHFRVESYIELSPVEQNRQTQMVVSVAVYFAKSSMLRSKIESGCIAETKVSYTRLVDAAVTRVNESTARKEHQVAEDDPHRDNLSGPPTSSSKEAIESRRDPEPLPSAQKSESNADCCASENAAQLVGESRPIAKAPTALPNTSTIVELQEAPWSRVLRLVAVVALMLIALMLVICILMLVGLQGDLRRLEKLALQRASASSEYPTACVRPLH